MGQQASRDHCEVAIIGTGPYGLSLAAHLRGRGVKFRIFGKPMDVWRTHMPKNMMLKSNGYASNLSAPDGGRSTLKSWARRHGRPYEDRGLPVTVSDFVAYADWFRARHVPTLEETLVTQVEPLDRGYGLTLETGERLTADHVVLAVGITWFARMPDELSALPGHMASHSYDHRTVEQFAGKDVVVVGAGASAINLAYELLEVGARCRLVARGDEIRYAEPPRTDGETLRQRMVSPPSPIGQGWRSLFAARLPGIVFRLPAHLRLRSIRSHAKPAGGWFMRERVLSLVPHLTERAIVKAVAEDGRVRLSLSNGEEMLCDHVVAATGYDMDVRRLGFLGESLRRRIAAPGQAPSLSGRFETGAPRLYALGALAVNSFGPVLRFVVGSGYAAPRLARTLQQRVMWERLRRAFGALYRSGPEASSEASAATIK